MLNRRQCVSILLFVFMLYSIAVSDDVQGYEVLRLLVVGDPFATALLSASDTLGERYGTPLDIEITSYNDLRDLTLLNARDRLSRYDVVAFDVLWMGEYGRESILLPLSVRIAQTPELEVDDFLALAYAQARFEGQIYGLPIQPHPELLWYRKDLFEAAGLGVPATTEDVLAAAAALHNPDEALYGICWNGQRNSAFGQQMAHFYGAFGQPLVDTEGLPTLNTERGIDAAQFALDLMPYSPPDILTMAWDQRTLRFAQGRCAMTYGWAARTDLVEHSLTSQVAGLVAYTAAPHAPGVDPVTPLGTWSLGIPANIGDRVDEAWAFLAWLSSAQQQRVIAEHGSGGTVRYSLMRDEALQLQYPAFEAVLQIDAMDGFSDIMRPSVPQWSSLERILGTVYHDVLRGELTVSQAAAQAQEAAEVLFAEERDLD